MSDLTIRLDTERRFIPAVPPPGGAAARTGPTTQVLVSVEEWPGNTFRLMGTRERGDAVAQLGACGITAGVRPY